MRECLTIISQPRDLYTTHVSASITIATTQYSFKILSLLQIIYRMPENLYIYAVMYENYDYCVDTTYYTHIFAWLMLFGSINCYEIDVVVRFVRNFGGCHAHNLLFAKIQLAGRRMVVWVILKQDKRGR